MICRICEEGELDGTRVDVVSGEVHATEEQRQAVLEMPLDEGAGQTHFDKVKQRIEEDKKKKKIREGK